MKRIIGKIRGWRLGSVLLSPWVIIASAVAGALIGIADPGTARAIAPIGEIYLALLEMCVMPILFAAIALNVGRIVSTSGEGNQVSHLGGYALLLFLCASVIGIGAGVSGQPGTLAPADREALGIAAQNSGYAPDLEIALDSRSFAVNEPAAITFLKRMVPANIFEALTTGNNLKVLVFSLLFGFALGVTPPQVTETVFEALGATYSALSTLIQWFMYVLPLGLICMVAGQVVNAGMEIILVMTKFVAVSIAAMVVVCLVGSFLLWRRMGGSYFGLILAMKEPVALAFGTSNGMACIPSSIAVLEAMGFERRDVGLVVPLSISTCRFGNILYFAVAALFVAQVYESPLGPIALAIAVPTSILAGTATAGASGVLTLIMLDIMLMPMGLPLSGILPLLIVVEPVMTPFRTIVNVFLTCVLAGLWSRRNEEVIVKA